MDKSVTEQILEFKVERLEQKLKKARIDIVALFITDALLVIAIVLKSL